MKACELPNMVDTRTMNTKLFAPRLYSGYMVIGIPALAALAGGIAALFGGAPILAAMTLLAAAAGAAFLAYAAWRDAHPAASGGPTASGSNEIPQDRLDPLTGLANMNGLNAWFAEKSQRLAQDNKAIIVLSADLANYAQLVRSRGQELADAVIKEAARRVASFTGEDGIAARTEGDEFAVVATVVPAHSLELTAERAGKLTELLQRPVELPIGVIWIGGSVGAATGSPLEGQAVLARAREALKKAKQVGQGHYVVDGLNTPHQA